MLSVANWRWMTLIMVQGLEMPGLPKSKCRLHPVCGPNWQPQTDKGGHNQGQQDTAHKTIPQRDQAVYTSRQKRMKHKEWQSRNTKGNTLSTSNYKGDKRIPTRAKQKAHRIAGARH